MIGGWVYLNEVDECCVEGEREVGKGVIGGKEGMFGLMIGKVLI